MDFSYKWIPYPQHKPNAEAFIVDFPEDPRPMAVIWPRKDGTWGARRCKRSGDVGPKEIFASREEVTRLIEADFERIIHNARILLQLQFMGVPLAVLKDLAVKAAEFRLDAPEIFPECSDPNCQEHAVN